MIGPSTEQAKAEAAPAPPTAEREPLGLYVHVPFCASTCDFCAFYQTQPTAGDVQRFLRGINLEAALVEWTRPITTVFWGGGTPGLLAARDLTQLAAAVAARCGGVPAEWTVELAPGSVTDARLAALRDAGVTRISMGVQSFQAPLLEALGRQHNRTQIYRAYDRVRTAGFTSVNLDLMFALPGQTAAEWAADVAEAVALAPDHVSTYCLTFEEDAKLWLKLSQGRVKLDPEFEARLYEDTWCQLGEAGYEQYEVSNFARPGHPCVHNLNTWRMGEWIGLGPSAASQQEGWRGSNVADFQRWLCDLEAGVRVTQERTAVSPMLLLEDAIVFGLRMNAGVDLAPWRRRVPDAPWSALSERFDRLQEADLLVAPGDLVCLTNRGRLLADAVGVEIMAAFEPAPTPA